MLKNFEYEDVSLSVKIEFFLDWIWDFKYVKLWFGGGCVFKCKKKKNDKMCFKKSIVFIIFFDGNNFFFKFLEFGYCSWGYFF